MHGLKLLCAALMAAVSACASPPPPGAALAAGDNAAFSHEVSTAAPRAAVWALWTDPATWKDWDRGLRDAGLDGPMAEGARGTITPLDGPPAPFTVTAYSEGEAYAFATDLPLATLTVRRVFVGDAPTRLRHEVRFSGPLGWFWADRFGPGFRAALPPTMESLARLAESRAAAAVTP
ncbi:MAG: SRPBCC family protein [Hyphomonadaceae bacterium]|nr:SRPBCC family protein [Hyphomonadaceae bacterium]